MIYRVNSNLDQVEVVLNNAEFGTYSAILEIEPYTVIVNSFPWEYSHHVELNSDDNQMYYPYLEAKNLSDEDGYITVEIYTNGRLIEQGEVSGSNSYVRIQRRVF